MLVHACTQDVARGTNSSLGQLLGSDFEPPSTLPRTSRVKRKTHDETSKADKPRRGRPRKQVGHNTAPVGSVTEALSPAPEGDREAQRSALGTSHSLTVSLDIKLSLSSMCLICMRCHLHSCDYTLRDHYACVLLSYACVLYAHNVRVSDTCVCPGYMCVCSLFIHALELHAIMCAGYW